MRPERLEERRQVQEQSNAYARQEPPPPTEGGNGHNFLFSNEWYGRGKQTGAGHEMQGRGRG